MVWWTPLESHKAGRCSPIGRHNIARVLIRDQWTGESLTCDVSSTGPRSYPLVERKVTAEASVKGGLTHCVVTLLRQRAPGVRREWIELETGQVKMGEAYVGTPGVSKHMPS